MKLMKTRAWYEYLEDLIFELEDHPHKEELLALCEEQFIDDHADTTSN